MTLCISSESVTTSSPPLRIRFTRLSLSSRSSAVNSVFSLRLSLTLRSMPSGLTCSGATPSFSALSNSARSLSAAFILRTPSLSPLFLKYSTILAIASRRRAIMPFSPLSDSASTHPCRSTPLQRCRTSPPRQVSPRHKHSICASSRCVHSIPSRRRPP